MLCAISQLEAVQQWFAWKMLSVLANWQNRFTKIEELKARIRLRMPGCTFLNGSFRNGGCMHIEQSMINLVAFHYCCLFVACSAKGMLQPRIGRQICFHTTTNAIRARMMYCIHNRRM